MCRTRDPTPPSTPTPSSWGGGVSPHRAARVLATCPLRGVIGSPGAVTSPRSLRGRGGARVDPSLPSSCSRHFGPPTWSKPASPCGHAQPWPSCGKAPLEVLLTCGGKQCPGVRLSHWGAVRSRRCCQPQRILPTPSCPAWVVPRVRTLVPRCLRDGRAPATERDEGEKGLCPLLTCTFYFASRWVL